MIDTSFRMRAAAIAILVAAQLDARPLHAANAPDAKIEVGEQPALPEDGCVYAGLGYSDRVFINVKPGIYQCRAEHWYLSVDASPSLGISPTDFAAVRVQPTIAGDGCIYAGLGYSDGAVIQTSAGAYLCKSHHWDHSDAH